MSKNTNKFGFTVVELIVSFSLSLIIAIFLFQIIINLKNLYTNSVIKTEIINIQSLLSEKINDSFENNVITSVNKCGKNCFNFVYINGKNEKLSAESNYIEFGTYKAALPQQTNINGIDVNISSAATFSDNIDNSMIIIDILINNERLKNENFNFKIIHQYNSLNNNILFEEYVQDGLISYIDGTKKVVNNILQDMSGNNNYCTMKGFDNFNDNVLTFDGIDDTCVFNKPMTPQKFSISAVIEPENKNEQHVVFVSWLGYTFELNTDNTISFGIYQNPTKNYLKGGKFEYNKKNFITLTFDGIKSIIYVNGLKVAEATNSKIVYNTTSTDISSIKYNTYKGKLYNLLFYNRDLSADEVMQNYLVAKQQFNY